MWQLWKQLLWCGCVLDFYGTTVHFCWGQLCLHCIVAQYSRSDQLDYIIIVKIIQPLGLSQASPWGIVGPSWNINGAITKTAITAESRSFSLTIAWYISVNKNDWKIYWYIYIYRERDQRITEFPLVNLSETRLIGLLWSKHSWNG